MWFDIFWQLHMLRYIVKLFLHLKNIYVCDILMMFARIPTTVWNMSVLTPSTKLEDVFQYGDQNNEILMLFG